MRLTKLGSDTYVFCFRAWIRMFVIALVLSTFGCQQRPALPMTRPAPTTSVEVAEDGMLEVAGKEMPRDEFVRFLRKKQDGIAYSGVAVHASGATGYRRIQEALIAVASAGVPGGSLEVKGGISRPFIFPEKQIGMPVTTQPIIEVIVHRRKGKAEVLVGNQLIAIADPRFSKLLVDAMSNSGVKDREGVDITMKPAADVRFDDLMTVYASCLDAGFNRLTFAVAADPAPDTKP